MWELIRNTIELWPAMLAGTAIDYAYGMFILPLIGNITGGGGTMTRIAVTNAAFMTKVAAAETSYLRASNIGTGGGIAGMFGFGTPASVQVSDAYPS